MAAKTHIALFVERFIEFNQTRYASDPEMLALFTDLTEAELTFGTITDEGQGVRSVDINSAARKFRALSQSWTAADAETELGLYTGLVEGPAPSLTDLKDETVPGLYVYEDDGDLKVGVVIAEDTAAGQEAAAIEAVIRAGLVYDITTITPDVTDINEGTVSLPGDTFAGTLQWVRGAAEIVEIPPTDYGVLTVS